MSFCLPPFHSYNSPNLVEAPCYIKQEEDDDDMFEDLFDFNDDMLVGSIDGLSISGLSPSTNSKNKTTTTATAGKARQEGHSDESPLTPPSVPNRELDYDQLWNQAGEMARKAFESFNDDENTSSSSEALSIYNHVPHRLSNDGVTNDRRDSKDPCNETLKVQFKSSSLAEWIKNNVEIAYDS